MSGLTIGGRAPDFTLRDQFGQDVTLSTFRGTKAVAIFFYPFAFSGVCTGEMAGIRERLDQFRRAQLRTVVRFLASRCCFCSVRRV
jgi:mycoredoxin-dependent peroxiredoxin